MRPKKCGIARSHAKEDLKKTLEKNRVKYFYSYSVMERHAIS
jgi:hypothetical protein